MILDALQEAIQSGHSLRVRYFGGSTPGREREVFPLSIADGKVRARCVVTQQTKTFVIEKMELVEAGVASVIAETFEAPPPVFDSVDELLAYHSSALEELGWEVQREGEAASLHRTFKNGKLVKSPDVSLRYEPMTFDLIFDGEKMVESNHRKRPRPWVVDAKGSVARAFGDIEKAQQAFLDLAKAMAPSTTPS